jgi:multisubunit Na+/H+ antiporter MnhC subunit
MGEDPKPESSKDKALGWPTRSWHAWLWLRERALTLKPCRVAILLVFAGLAFLLLAAQGEDVARALAERRSADPYSWQAFWFFTASLAWSLSAWYWARVMLSLRLPGVPAQDRRLDRLRTWTPRVLGFLATLGVAAAFYKASQGYQADEHQDVRKLLQFYAFWCAMGAVAFLVAVSVRRKVARAAYRKLNIKALNLPEAKEQAYGALDLKDLDPLTRALLLTTILAAAALFAVMVFGVQAAAPALGSAAIVLLAAAGWIAVASTLDFIGMRLSFPVFSALLVLAMAFSFWNDNHEVRTLAEPQAAKRHNVRAHLRAWLDQHDAAIKRGQRVPFYVVNAEGGGIRAAYWTVTVLGEIHNRHPDFADHVFSLSGVSGGSLGAAVFVALIAEQRASQRAGKEPFDLKQKAQAVLSEDFLSPVVAGMLFPDLAQRFLPFPVRAFDRAVTLEQAWEEAWRRNVGGRNRMAEPFDRLWQGEERWMPTLLLNATWVETGKRIITSNIRVAAGRRREDFVDVEDANAFFAPRSLPLSTAAHMSARFTYVSPAGTLVKDGNTHGHVVDGGYFENSGATATLAILQIVTELARTDKRWEKVDPYVIHISNEPVDAKYTSDSLMTAPFNPSIEPTQFLNEAMSPLRTLLNTRAARGYYARESVAWQVGHANYLHFGLCRRSTNVPLGWVLAQSTRDRMEDQLRELRCMEPGSEPIFDNPGNLKKISARFALVPSAPSKGTVK